VSVRHKGTKTAGGKQKTVGWEGNTSLKICDGNPFLKSHKKKKNLGETKPRRRDKGRFARLGGGGGCKKKTSSVYETKLKASKKTPTSMMTEGKNLKVKNRSQ